jgi:hypothetical protein
VALSRACVRAGPAAAAAGQQTMMPISMPGIWRRLHAWYNRAAFMRASFRLVIAGCVWLGSGARSVCADEDEVRVSERAKIGSELVAKDLYTL